MTVTIPSRVLLPLAGLGLVGFIVMGLLASQRIDRIARGPDIREQSVTVNAADGTPLAVRLIEPSGSKVRPTAVLAGLPVENGRFDLARALARRGWAVSVLDLRGTGGSRIPGPNANRTPDSSDSESWVRDLSDIAAWVHALPHASPDKPALVAVRAASAATLAAKGGTEDFRSLALILPIVPLDRDPLGAPAYRSTPSGVLVVSATPFTLPAEVSGFLKEPTRTETVATLNLAGVIGDLGLIGRIDAWLRNPGNGA